MAFRYEGKNLRSEAGEARPEMESGPDVRKLQQLLARAKQMLTELDSLGMPEHWGELRGGDPGPHGRAAELVIFLAILDQAVDRILNRYVGGQEIETVPLPPGLRAFLLQRWIPRREEIREANEKLTSWDEMNEADPDDVDSFHVGSDDSLSVLSDSVLDFVRSKAEDDPTGFWITIVGVERLEAAWKAGYIDLDAWHMNRREVRPIVSRRAARDIPGHVRRRLVEIQRSFIFGNWLAVAALARATLEYVLIDRAAALRFDPFHAITREPLRLAELIEKAKGHDHSLASEMDVVRSCGNRVMHPRKHERAVHHPGSMRNDAKSVLRAVFAIVETLYPAKDERR